MELMTHPALKPLLALLLLLFVAAPAEAATRYITIVNDDFRTVVQVEMALAGSHDFQTLDISTPLIGGREGQATVVIPAGACLRDLRVIYRDASLLTITGWNVCRQSVFHIGAVRQAAARQRQPI